MTVDEAREIVVDTDPWDEAFPHACMIDGCEVDADYVAWNLDGGRVGWLCGPHMVKVL